MRRIIVVIWMLAMALFAPSARGHDFGAMLVTLDASSAGEIVGTIRVDPSHLPAEMARAFLGRSPEENRQAGERLLGQLRHDARLIDDAGRVLPIESFEIVPSVTNGSKDEGLIVASFRATIPADARTLAWSCATPIGKYLFRVSLNPNEEGVSQWLRPGEASDPVELPVAGEPRSAPEATPTSTLAVFGEYVRLGFTHIIPEGPDHILFVLGLFLMSARLKPVLAQATAFTLAHSVTLGLAITGYLTPAPSIVEPLIAASIAAVGIENMLVKRYTRRRVGVAFAFGLVHGLGFAGVLSDVGLPPERLAPALAGFNVGVELGQMAVIAAAFLAVGLWFRDRAWYRARVTIPASAAITLVALGWVVERMG